MDWERMQRIHSEGVERRRRCRHLLSNSGPGVIGGPTYAPCAVLQTCRCLMDDRARDEADKDVIDILHEAFDGEAPK